MEPGRRIPDRRVVRGMAAAAVGLLLGCQTRDRPLFPDPVGPGGTGPQTLIDVPAADTTVTAGPGYVVTGLSTDPDGIDTLYFETEGGASGFPPFTGGEDSVRFGLPLTTSGLAGDTITLRVFGTDRLGNRGDTATRRIAVE